MLFATAGALPSSDVNCQMCGGPDERPLLGLSVLGCPLINRILLAPPIGSTRQRLVDPVVQHLSASVHSVDEAKASAEPPADRTAILELQSSS